MSRTLRINPKTFAKDWNYPKSRKYCTHCGHRYCYDPTTIDGTKSMKKSKGTHVLKRYSKSLIDDG